MASLSEQLQCEVVMDKHTIKVIIARLAVELNKYERLDKKENPYILGVLKGIGEAMDILINELKGAGV